MNKITLFYIISFGLIFTACNSNWVSPQPNKLNFHKHGADISDKPVNAEPGKCYAKTNIPIEEGKNKTQKIFEYTGTDYNIDGIFKKTIVLVSGGTRWEKGKSDPNCLSPNPEDCMVMCLVDFPSVTQDYYIVTDTIVNKEFKITEVPANLKERNVPNSSWIEVICEAGI